MSEAVKLKYSILIVDDETANIRILSSILIPAYSIYTAKDGKTALDMAVEFRPDIILLDIIMPGLSGFEVLNKLKKSDITRDIPVIFITGKNSVEDEVKGFMLGAVDYITKPFNNTIVKVRVRQHLQTVKQMRTIERLGMIDALTDIANRRSFDIQLTREWGRAIREKEQISILIIDIDRFKVYNDTYGHQQGDILLQALAEIFKQLSKRKGDFAARWGGEEFAILLPNTDLQGAIAVAEQIRATVEKAVIQCPDGINTSVTISIGVNTEQPGPDDKADSFISLADKRLYAAKDSGRNKVCWRNPAE